MLKSQSSKADCPFYINVLLEEQSASIVIHMITFNAIFLHPSDWCAYILSRILGWKTISDLYSEFNNGVCYAPNYLMTLMWNSKVISVVSELCVSTTILLYVYILNWHWLSSFSTITTDKQTTFYVICPFMPQQLVIMHSCIFFYLHWYVKYY